MEALRHGGKGSAKSHGLCRGGGGWIKKACRSLWTAPKGQGALRYGAAGGKVDMNEQNIL